MVYNSVKVYYIFLENNNEVTMTKINFTNISEDILWKIIRTNVKAVNVKANELRETNERAKSIRR